MRNDNTAETGPVSLLPLDSQFPQDDSKHSHRHYARPLKIRRVPMQHGWYWLIEGFMLWARSPAFLSFLAFSCIFGIVVAQAAPKVGELLGSILYPGLMLGVFNGCRAIDRKRTLSPGLLFSGFRRHAFDLLLAGFCNFIALTLMLLATWPIDGGMMWRVVIHGELPNMESTLFRYSLIVTMVLSMMWAAVYLFVPQLIGWWRLSVPKALFFSLKGCLVNWLPFFTYAFCFSFFVVVLSALVINFFELTYEGLGVVVCAVFLLITSPALIASFYVAARDIFGFPRRRKHKKRTSEPALDERKKRRAKA
ncbi:MAG: hypothetical protein FWD51_02215 [Betaproteobacteria bacterium]|nr:hypothetical protein [Betaproteobacteria bacterium]